MDKSLIINTIKNHLGFKKEIDFAKFLGINQSTLSAWHKRGSINYELIIAKCKDIDANWLLTGKGQMLKKNKTDPLNSEKTTFKEGLNSHEVELLKKDLDNALSTIENQKDMINTQRDLINSLKSEIELIKKTHL